MGTASERDSRDDRPATRLVVTVVIAAIVIAAVAISFVGTVGHLLPASEPIVAAPLRW